MYFIFKILIALSILTSFSFSNSLVNKNLYDKKISINKGSYKILEFEKMITSIKVSDQESLEVDFLENESKPLQAIKVFSKKLGHSNLLITFEDASSLHVDINVIENLINVIAIAKDISPKLTIKQTNGKLILRGKVKNQKTKDKILSLFKAAGVKMEEDFVDLSSLENPDKMIRVKLFAVEINNNKGLDLKNNWFFSFQNYTTSYGEPKIIGSNKGKLSGYTPAIANAIENPVTLTGGLTAAANYLGNGFNTGLTLNYLASKGVANILDETTLLTLENKKATFLAGGIIYIKVQTTTSQGVPSTDVRDIKYGLQLDIQAKNIVDDKFINLEIVTKSKAVDFTNTVDGIPNFTEKSISTNVIAGNGSTIVLGGLVNRNNAKDINKIPLLGDIPILGHLFSSKAFKEGKSELVFFITPEIIDPKINNEQDFLEDRTKFTKEIDKKFNKPFEEKVEAKKVENKKVENTVEEKAKPKVEDKKTEEITESVFDKLVISEEPAHKELSARELHDKRVRELLGY